MINSIEVIRKETQPFDSKIALRERAGSVSYRQLWARVAAAADWLRSQGVSERNRIALVCHENMDCVVHHLAILAVGAVMVPIPKASSSSETGEMVRRLGVHALILEEGRRLLRFGVSKEFPEAFETVNPAFIRFTSGTTGASKGVVISHEAILARTEAANQGLQITNEDQVIWVLSMAFHFVVTILLFLRKGATIVLCHDPYPEAMTEALEEGGATLIYASPFHYQTLLNAESLNRGHFSHLRMAVSTTAHLSETISDSFFSKYGVALSSAYGIIEVGLPFMNRSGNGKRASVGQILPGYQCQVREADAQGVGTLYLKGPGMFEAYCSPWEMRRQMDQEGWFATGDLGYLDREGFLFLVGRSKQTISFTGMKIFPQEIEDVIMQYHGIEACCVFGIEHATLGQLPSAKIVLKDGFVPLDEEALRRFCYDRLAKYKVPKTFECVPSLKRTKSDKVKVEP